MSLPHNAHLISVPLDQAIDQALREPQVEVDLAVSHLWDFDGDFDEIEAAYDNYFLTTVDGISSILGDPIYRGRWDAPDRSEWESILPEYADAQELVVWARDSRKLYCRLSWEDKEIPIKIAIGAEGCAATGTSYDSEFD
jgi:hypothetical protein